LANVMTEEEYRAKVIKEFKALYKFGHPMFYDLIIDLCNIHEVKNKAYGIGNPLGNFMECERFGIPAWKGALVRITDKVARVYNLTTKIGNPEYADAFEIENLEDTLFDLSCYALLCLILFREEKKKKVLREVLQPVGDNEATCCEKASP